MPCRREEVPRIEIKAVWPRKKGLTLRVDTVSVFGGNPAPSAVREDSPQARRLYFPLFSFAQRGVHEGMPKSDVSAMVRPICERMAMPMGYEVVDVSLDKEPTVKYLRIYIDKPEGVTLDDCEAYHRAVMPLLERFDYDFMEVSSPGIDRPLKTERDFERNLGAEVEVHLFKPMDGVKQLTGILAGLEDGDILLDTPAGEKRISRKAAALVRPIVDMEGVEEVDLSDGEDFSGAGQSETI